MPFIKPGFPDVTVNTPGTSRAYNDLRERAKSRNAYVCDIVWSVSYGQCVEGILHHPDSVHTGNGPGADERGGGPSADLVCRRPTDQPQTNPEPGEPPGIQK